MTVTTAGRLRTRTRKLSWGSTTAKSGIRSSISLAVGLGLILAAAAPAGANLVGSGTHPWAVVLCNFNNQKSDPAPASLFGQMYGDVGAGSGQFNFEDYWRDVSFGQLSVAGTTVVNGPHADANGWYTINEPRDTWGYSRDRFDKVKECANAALQDVDYTKYWGVMAMFPEAQAHPVSAISATATTVTLDAQPHSGRFDITATNYFPTPPFLASIENEVVNVTAIANTTNGQSVFTIDRGQCYTAPDGTKPCTTAAAHSTLDAKGNRIVFGVNGDYGQTTGSPVGHAPGQSNVTLADGKGYQLALVVLPNENNLAGSAHETGHGFGYNHTRKLSTSTVDYKDATDNMSIYDGTFTLTNLGSPFGGGVFGTGSGDKGPGLDAGNLDLQGWIPGPRHYTRNDAATNQATITMHALSDPGALSAPSPQYLEARVPASANVSETIPGSNPPVTTVVPSDYYTVEYRQIEGWDRGFTQVSNQPGDVVLHLHAPDPKTLVDPGNSFYPFTYWVDTTPLAHGGLFVSGDAYVDAANKTYVAVNSMSGSAQTATLTLGSSPLAANLALSGDTKGDFNDRVTLAADLTVGGAPVPSEPVVLSLGIASCSPTTSSTGHVSCSVTLNQDPGSYTVTASFTDPNGVYRPLTTSAPFAVNKEQSTLTYTGATTADYHDSFTASGTLVDPDGGAPIADKPITFTLGSGDSCTTLPTDGSGNASCMITPTQAAGSYSLVASFGPDTDYLASSATTALAITKEQTTLSYDGPFQVANDFPATLKGTLLEDGTTAPVPSGQTVTFVLGSGATAQSCPGVVDATGHVQCTIPSVQQPDSATFTVAVSDSFTGDAYYLPSNASGTAKLLYYTGRAFGASVGALGVLSSTFADTGQITTAQKSQTQRASLLATLLGVNIQGMTANVMTGAGSSSAQASATSLLLSGLPLPSIQATTISASSQSTCGAAIGSSTIAKLTINGASIPVNNLAPNTKLSVAGLTITLNEQLPVAGADKGLTVNAIHITSALGLNIVSSSATSDIHNCP